jgi:hypothetical protein
VGDRVESRAEGETNAIHYKERRKEQKTSILLKGEAIKIFTFGNLLCVSNE